MVNAYQVGTQYMVERGSGKFPPEPSNPNHYWELSQQTDYERVFTLRSTEPSHTVQDLRTEDTLREENKELMRRLELQRNDNNFLSRENHKLRQDFDEMRQGGLEQNRKLQEQADKFRLLYHEERQLKEKAQRELGEVCTKLAAKECIEDYDEYQVRHSPISAKFHTDRIYKWLTAAWVAIVAFAVNEVIQWLTR